MAVVWSPLTVVNGVIVVFSGVEMRSSGVTKSGYTFIY